MFEWPSTVGPKPDERRSKGRAVPKLCKRPQGLGQWTGVWKSQWAHVPRPRGFLMGWRNAREVPAGPQGGSIADVCIMKQRLLSKNNPLRAPFMRAPFGFT